MGHFARTGNTTLLSDVEEIVKPECCTCSQAQVLQKNCWDNVAEYCNMLQKLGTPGHTCNDLTRLNLSDSCGGSA